MKTEVKAMRDVFIEEIYNRMHEDRNIFFLSADFGSPKLDKLREDFRDRFINVGIAEQNLINISTGLALEGFSYDVSGPTHHCIEDITIMRSLPNFIIFSPSDWVLAQWFTDYSIKVKKPKYIRFDGKPLPSLYNITDCPDVVEGLGELKRG